MKPQTAEQTNAPTREAFSELMQRIGDSHSETAKLKAALKEGIVIMESFKRLIESTRSNPGDNNTYCDAAQWTLEAKKLV